MKTDFLKLVKEVIVEIPPQGKMHSLLMMNTESLTQSDNSMYAFTRRVAGCQMLITPITGHVKHHTGKIQEKHGLEWKLPQKLSGTIYKPPLATPKM